MNGVRASLALKRPGFELDCGFILEGRGVTALYGPSGCGKTTLLRAIAGLEPSSGFLEVQGEVWQDDGRGLRLPAHRRSLGYVFQDARLFPHLDVQKNLHYAWQRTPKGARKLAPGDVVPLLGLEPLLKRRPHTLSGGERSRAAIARALLASPALLVMDEPLAALDGASRAEILPYLERVPASLDLPVIYVSHALDEVMRLADQLLLMEAGRILASGPLADVVTRADLWPARGDDAGAVFEGAVARHDEEFQLSVVRVAGVDILVARLWHDVGSRVRVRILARDVSLTLARAQQTSIQNIVPARVVAVEALTPAQALVKLDLNGSPLLARITRKSVVELALAPGRAVFAQIKSIALLA